MDLLDRFRALPESEQRAIFALLNRALKWRGWDAADDHPLGGGRHARDAVREIGEIFARNGAEVEEYT